MYVEGIQQKLEALVEPYIAAKESATADRREAIERLAEAIKRGKKIRKVLNEVIGLKALLEPPKNKLEKDRNIKLHAKAKDACALPLAALEMGMLTAEQKRQLDITKANKKRTVEVEDDAESE